MKVILLTHGGADLVIEKLSQMAGIELVGVFVENKTSPKRSFSEKLRRSIRYDGYAATLAKFARRNGSASNGHNVAPDKTLAAAATAGVPVVNVDDYHSKSAMEALRSLEPDLGIIFGTNIIKEPVFSIPRLGSINLHQGLAPFYRGGPPVFWELFNGESEVGLTVHYVAPKVDTGDIISQKTRPLAYDPSFGSDFESFIERFRESLREECAQMVADAVASIASGTVKPTLQDTSLGKRYRLPTKAEKDELRRRLTKRRRDG